MPPTTIVVLVPEAEPVVAAVRERYDVWARRGLGAHVTVAPFLPTERIDEATVARLRGIVASHARRAFSLVRVQSLPGAVLLLPDPYDPFRELRAALEHAWPETRRRRRLRARVVGPHLTVARTLDPRAVRRMRHAIEPSLPLPVQPREAHLVALADRAEVRLVLPFG